MRVIFHTNSPHVNTGYGQQCAVWAPRWRSLGHEVIVSSFYGIAGTTLEWNGILTLPPGADPYGNDILGEHARRVGADMIITLMDAWVLAPEQTQGLKVANWMPVDCDPLGVMDRNYLQRSGSVPIAISRYGQRKLEEAGFKALYVPHSVDMEDTFRPVRDRAKACRDLGLPEDAFLIGINAANKDTVRKSYPAQIRAFAEFTRRHPEANAMLLIHALPRCPGALDLQAIIEDQGVSQQVRFSDWYTYVTGAVQPVNLAVWYNVLDVLSNASHGEGFGLAIIEAAACGTPAVVTDHSAMTELAGAGWMVGGEPFWNGQLAGITGHQAWWKTPYADEITAAYESAYAEKVSGEASARRVRARSFAVQYDADRVLAEYWAPVLKELEEM